MDGTAVFQASWTQAMCSAPGANAPILAQCFARWQVFVFCPASLEHLERGEVKPVSLLQAVTRRAQRAFCMRAVFRTHFGRHFVRQLWCFLSYFGNRGAGWRRLI